jgi:transglutaminase-like putative cysteine protease
MLVLPEQQRILTFEKRKYLALAQWVVLFPLLFTLPTIIAVFILLPPSWVLLASYRNKDAPINRWLLMVITLALALFIWRYFGTLRGKDAGVALIAVMYSLKILESWHYRELNLLLTLGFFVLAMSFLFIQSFWLLLYLFFAYGFLMYVLMRANTYHDLAIDWRSSAKLLGWTIPIMILLFLFFPRLPGPLWKMPGEMTAGTGITDSMTPGDIGVLNLSEEPAFRVKFLSKKNFLPNQLYWRGLVFEHYDGVNWRPDQRRKPIDNSVRYVEDAMVSYQVTMEATKQRWLFGLDIPIESDSNAIVFSDGTFVSRFNINQRYRYQMTSAIGAVIEAELSPLARQINLNLPESSNPQARQWAVEQFSRIQDAELFVDFLLRYINQQPFYYTLNPPIMMEQMVDDFWFNHKRGFCEHYAGSVVFMLRAAGIPARVVTGYQGGEYNEIGDYYLIMQRDAHAWLEYWLDGKGWVRVDPTSAIAPSRIEANLLQDIGQRGWLFDSLPELESVKLGWIDFARQWMDNANTFWREWILDFNQTSQWDLLSRLSLHKLPKSWLYGLVMTIIVLITVLMGYRWIGAPIKQDRLSKTMHRWLSYLAKQGIEKAPNEGMLDFAARVAKQIPEKKNTIDEIVLSYLELRFGYAEFSTHQLVDLEHKVKHYIASTQ